MAAIVDMTNAKNGSGFEGEVKWVGFDKQESTWEDLAEVWDAAPLFVKSELHKLGLKRGVRTQLKHHVVSSLAIFV